MARPDSPTLSAARTTVAWLLLALPAGSALAQSDLPRAEPLPEASRLDRLERTLNQVVDENHRLADEVRRLKQELADRPAREAASPPLPPPSPPAPDPPVEAPVAAETPRPRYKVDYDRGFALLPENLDDSPYSLKVNFQDTFRYNGFARGVRTWTDSAGIVRPIANANFFGIPRGRVIFSGNVFLPRLVYNVNLDYNTVTTSPINFRAYWLGYKFSRSAELYVGQSKVPGSREWLVSSFVALEGADRSMATTFFRPSLSQGIWLTGQPLDRFYYHAMLSNGFNTQNITPAQLDARFCWSGSVWWEPWGDFGPGYADIEDHRDPAVRLGASGTFAAENGNQGSSNAPENAAIRLSDGTLISETGALAPGVTLQQFDIGLAALDLAFKYRGASLSLEGYAHDLTRLRGTGPIPINAIRAYGGLLQGGYFVVPKRLELYARTSAVTGRYGSGAEYAGGFNWYPVEGKSNIRFTLDATWLDSSPAEQNRTGYAAGQTGFLLRTQITTNF